MSAGAFILDSETRGILNENYLQYDGTPTITAEGNSNLGGLTSSVQSITQIIVLGTSNLGLLNSEVSALVAHFVEGATNLGSLDATADTIPTILPIFEASLGSINSSSNSFVEKIVSGSANLGNLIGQAQASSDINVVGTASLGGLSASAINENPNPPTPDEPKYGSNGYVPIKKKQKKERPTPVIVAEITDIPELEPLIKTVFAKGAAAEISELFAQAENRIDFSILRDEQELMMLL